MCHVASHPRPSYSHKTPRGNFDAQGKTEPCQPYCRRQGGFMKSFLFFTYKLYHRLRTILT